MESTETNEIDDPVPLTTEQAYVNNYMYLHHPVYPLAHNHVLCCAVLYLAQLQLLLSLW